MPHGQESKLTVISDGKRTGEHLRVVGIAFRGGVIIDPHQGVARGRDVSRLQGYADEVMVPSSDRLVVASRDLMALPPQLGGVPLAVGRAAIPAKGLVLMSWGGLAACRSTKAFLGQCV
jgi:hypothetical protein